MSNRFALLGLTTAAIAVPYVATTRATTLSPPHSPAADTSYVVAATDSAAGAYLTIVGGCNDCHTST